MGGGSGKVMEDAFQLASTGIALLPIDSTRKEPCYDVLPRNKKTGRRTWIPLRETPATPSKIRFWFRKKPNCNIAIITGQTSNLAVLDIDGPIPPDLVLPNTVTAKTPREIGGHHYYFRIEGSQKSGKFTWEEEGVRYQCELKADGSYAVCPPSSFGTKRYRWSSGLSLFEQEPELLPPSLVPYLEGKSRIRKAKRREGTFSPVGETPVAEATGKVETLEWYEQLQFEEEVAIKVMRQCGVEVSMIGETFLCPLPGHEEKHPSAALWRNESGIIMFHDFHARDGQEWYSLPYVYALCKTGKRQLRLVDETWEDRWWARALHESGCGDRPLPTLSIVQTLPKDAPRHAQIVYKAVCYLAQLEEWFYGTPSREVGGDMPFSARFATAWANMSPHTYTKGLAWLSGNEYLEVKDIEDLVAHWFPSNTVRRVTDSKRRSYTYVVLTKPEREIA